MLKQYLAEHNISIYRLAKTAGTSYSATNDFVNLKTDVDSVSVGFLKKLASACGLSLDEMYAVCSDKFIINRKLPVRIRIQDGKYFAEYAHNGETYRCYVSRITKSTTKDIKPITEMMVDQQIHEREERKKADALLSHA